MKLGLVVVVVVVVVEEGVVGAVEALVLELNLDAENAVLQAAAAGLQKTAAPGS